MDKSQNNQLVLSGGSSKNTRNSNANNCYVVDIQYVNVTLTHHGKSVTTSCRDPVRVSFFSFVLHFCHPIG